MQRYSDARSNDLRRNNSRQSKMMMTAAKSPLASSVVKPKFQSAVSVAELYSMAARKNPSKFRNMSAPAFSNMKPQIGLTYFPPMNCNPTIIAPEASRSKLKFTATAAVLPQYFNWGDAQNVADTKNWGLRDPSLGPYIVPPPNQLVCGSCWAVASAGVFSDRWAIFTQGANPNLSATNVIGCVSDNSSLKGAAVNFGNTDGCNGGIPAAAAELMAQNGIVNNTCASYAWCDNNEVCNGRKQTGGDSGAYLNGSVVPACSAVTGCIDCSSGACTAQRNAPQPQLFKAKRYTQGSFNYNTKNPNIPKPPPKAKTTAFTVPVINDATSAAISLTNIMDIKNEILANGPVVGAFAVFADFQAGTAYGVGDDWAATKNVYCNVQGSGAKPYMNTKYAGLDSQLMGWHAISIIGWGVESNVDDWAHPGAKISIPYWIVRNSWSDAWNANCTVNNGNGGTLKMPGFFKIAMTDNSRGINTEVHLDNADANATGGATAFEPAVARVDPPVARGGTGGGGGKRGFGAANNGFNFADHTCTEGTEAAKGIYDTIGACIAANSADAKAGCDRATGCMATGMAESAYDNVAACTADGKCLANGYDQIGDVCAQVYGGTPGKYAAEQECKDVFRAECGRNTGCSQTGLASSKYENLAACNTDCVPTGFDLNTDKKCVPMFGLPAGQYKTSDCVNNGGGAECDTLNGCLKNDNPKPEYPSIDACQQSCTLNGYENIGMECVAIYGRPALYKSMEACQLSQRVDCDRYDGCSSNPTKEAQYATKNACSAVCKENGYDFKGNKCVVVHGDPKGVYATPECKRFDCNRESGCVLGTESSLYDTKDTCDSSCGPNGYDKNREGGCLQVYGNYPGGYEDDKCQTVKSRFKLMGNACVAVQPGQPVDVCNTIYPSLDTCAIMNASKMTAKYDVASNSCSVVADGSGNSPSMAECKKQITNTPLPLIPIALTKPKYDTKTVNIVVLSVALGLSVMFMVVMCFMVKRRCM